MVAMSQPNKLLLCHLLLLLLAAAEAHHRIYGYKFRLPGCVPELALTMSGQPLGTSGHAAQGGTVNVDVAVDGGLIANTYKARSAEPNGMIAVLAVPEGLQAESRSCAYDRLDHAVLLTRYGLTRSVGHDGMTVVSVVEAAEEEGPFAHGEHAVQLTRDGTQRSAGLNGTMVMSVPAEAEAGSFAFRREHNVLHDGRWHTNEQAVTCLASVPLVWIGQIPGPTIRAEQGGAADVTVNNYPLTEHVAIHWHGIRQIGTPWADGTEGVAQCPIPPGDTFTCRFVVDQPGAYTRHAHHGVQRSPGLNLNCMTFVAVPACQAEPFAYGREHTDVHLAHEDTQRTAGSDNGMTAVLVPGHAEAERPETLACDCDHPVVPLDKWWNWHAQVAAGVAAVPSVLVGEPQLYASYSVRACFNCSLLASGTRDATRPDCSPPAPFTVAPGKTYHIVTSSGLLFDRAVHVSTASLIFLIMVVQVAVDDQRGKNGGGRHTAVAMALILLLVMAARRNTAMAAQPLHGDDGYDGVHENKAAAGSACTHDPNTKDPHGCIHH